MPGPFDLEQLAAPFTRRIWITADVGQVREAWLNARELESWFLESVECWDAAGEETDRMTSGGRTRWVWPVGEDSFSVHRADADSLEIGWYNNEGKVSIRWEQHDGEAVVELTQEMLEGPLEERARRQLDCLEGWVFYLANLKGWLESRVDLREKNPGRKGIVNV